jgi:hypothetical protein
VPVMPGDRAGRRPRDDHQRLVAAYRDAHSKLSIAYVHRPPLIARVDSNEVRSFLVELTQANLSLRLLRVLCHSDVRSILGRAFEIVDTAVRAPPSRGFYKDPEPWLLDAIDAVEEAARRDVQLEL